MLDTEILESITKTAGHVESRRIRCGKKNCKCATKIKEFLHGPYYYYRFWKLENGKYHQKRIYIDLDTYCKLLGVLQYFHSEIAGSHGNFPVDRANVKQQVAGGVNIDLQIYNSVNIKVQDIADMLLNA